MAWANLRFWDYPCPTPPSHMAATCQSHELSCSRALLPHCASAIVVQLAKARFGGVQAEIIEEADKTKWEPPQFVPCVRLLI